MLRILAQAERVLQNAADRLGGLGPWQRRGAAFGAGAFVALSFAPLYLIFLAPIGFTLFVWLIDWAAQQQRPMRASASIGWWFGFGYFLIGLYWMAFSFLVQAEQFAWMAPFAMLGMPAFLALFCAGAGALAVRFWSTGRTRVLVFIVAWCIFEYARGHILTGLPWNLAGQALAVTALSAQTAAWWGVYGLSILMVGLSVAPATFYVPAYVPAFRDGDGDKGEAGQTNLRQDHQTGKAVSSRSILKGAVIMAVGAAVIIVIGTARLSLVSPGEHEDVFVRIVQPNIPQREKIDPSLWGRNLQRHLKLSDGLKQSDARIYVIWPENSTPLIDEVGDALRAVSQTLPSNAILLAGAVRRDFQEDADPARAWRYYNSLAVISQTPKGRRAIAHYDKHHLVPFGEYLPFSKILRAIGLAQLAPFEEGFAKGAGPRTLSVGGPAFAPLICYEAIFPGALYPPAERPAWLLTVTNDAWFGDTSGPRQHLDQARLRAIESGLPMARSANTGISALIDSRGVYRHRVPLYQEGVIDAALPKAAQMTVYNRVGDWLFFILLIGCFLINLRWRRRA